MNTVKRWVFTDPYSADVVKETYTFPRNPKEMTSVYPERSISSFSTLQGPVLLYEGTTPAKQFSFSGPILEKTHFDALRHWVYDKKRRIVLADHFGRQLTLALKTIDLIPVRRINYYYSHDYRVDALIVKVTEPTVPNGGPSS